MKTYQGTRYVAGHAFRPGDSVIHGHYGQGQVLASVVEKNDERVDVQFVEFGKKETRTFLVSMAGLRLAQGPVPGGTPHTPGFHEQQIVRLVRAALMTGKVPKKDAYVDTTVGLDGYCYVGSEAVYHLLGQGDSGYRPCRVGFEDGSSHWYLTHRTGNCLDVTQDSLDDVWDPFCQDEEARPRSFITRYPSRRTQVVIDQVRAAERALSNVDG